MTDGSRYGLRQPCCVVFAVFARRASLHTRVLRERVAGCAFGEEREDLNLIILKGAEINTKTNTVITVDSTLGTRHSHSALPFSLFTLQRISPSGD